ncbi:MAG: hypothetical protein P1P90_02555 [Patescibacteria group bacterium]|nr:hypothetical protein [Patescibacteria group bacterium]
MNFEKNSEISNEKETLMQKFFQEKTSEGEDDVVWISLDQLRELKEKGIRTEDFLEYLVEKQGLLLHGSINQIPGNRLRSDRNILFASDKAMVSIMRSLYSNIDVDLGYPYIINEDNPFKLVIHTAPDGKFICQDRGYVYAVKKEGFKNYPEGSWQYTKETDEAEFEVVIETEKVDFNYPVEIRKDLKEIER